MTTDASLHTYSKYLSILRRNFDANSMDFVLDYQTVIDWIESEYDSVNTRKAFYTTLVFALKTDGRIEFADALKAFRVKQSGYSVASRNKNESDCESTSSCSGSS